MNITYSPELNRTVRYAQEEAKGLGHPYVSSAHLLLGLCRTESTAGEFLRTEGVTLPFAFRVVEHLYGAGEIFSQEPVPFDALAFKDLQNAQIESNRCKSILCQPEHLLLALFIDAGSICPATILPALGLRLTYSEIKSRLF